MKNTMAITAALLWGVSAVAAGAAEIKPGDKLRVTTSSALLRDAPRPFGAKTLKTLGLGDTVIFKGSAAGAWSQVEFQGMQGYVAQKSLVEAKKFSSFSKVGKVTESDLAAATKGFSPEIEQRNKSDNQQLRYDLMDQAEARSHVATPAQTTAQFRRDGALGEFRAGGK